MDLPKPGDRITAEHVRYIRDLAGRAMLSAGGTLALAGPGGISDQAPDWMWVKLGTNSGTSYAWTEQIESPSGTWANGPRSGTTSTDPAKEPNGMTTSLSGKFVKARRGDSGTLYFAFGAC